MGFLSKLFGVKASVGSLGSMTDHSLPSSLSWVTNSQINYESKAGQVYTNNVVAAGVSFLSRLFAEAPLTVEAMKGDKWEPLDSHPLVDLIDSPNPWYDGSVLWMGTLLSLVIDGNAYWLKIRNNANEVGGLAYVSHTQVVPKTSDRTRLVTHYEYTPLDGGTPIPITIDGIVHLRTGIDPAYPAKGFSALRAALREVVTDNEASNYSAAILANSGVPSVAIIPRGDAPDGLTPEKRDQLKYRWRMDTTGDARGNVVMMPFDVEIKELTITPEKLAIDKLRTVPVERICAAMGIDPMVIGLSSANKTYSNYKEALEAVVRLTVMPLKTIVAQQITKQVIKADYKEDTTRCAWDYSNVWVLQDDIGELWKTASTAYMAGVVTRADARNLLGLEVTDLDAVYYTDLTLGTEQAKQKLKADVQKALAVHRTRFEGEQLHSMAETENAGERRTEG